MHAWRAAHMHAWRAAHMHAAPDWRRDMLCLHCFDAFGCLLDQLVACHSTWGRKLTARAALPCLQALKPGGRALVAAKTYYFGVGGSTAAFKQRVQALGGFQAQTFAVEGKDVSLQREIIMLRKDAD